MNRKYLCFLLGSVITLLSSFTVNAQSQFTTKEKVELLRKINKSCADIKTVTYRINHDSKRLTEKNTFSTVAVCTLYIDPTNKVSSYNIVDEEFGSAKSRKYGHKIYNGEMLFSLTNPVDSLDAYKKPQILKNEVDMEAWLSSYNYLLLDKYFGKNKSLIGYDSFAENILLTEETFKDTPVYAITMTYMDNENSRDRIQKIYISKSNYLPVGSYSFWRWENMESYEYFDVEYLAINPEISPDEFKVAKDHTVNLVERYKVFKEKSKNNNQ
ncbi:hypothetical protein GN157_15355 [Flavobacterium rakeshii]|uniref:Deoxyribose-phosphate aldolase n=1 Tax=Flavobacterium rakeshii TaxID=1038845 RepID=A0A6N8HH71_9FLAO|nr:hypothetical protein [Flavobacterium rakeshii]MEE1900157.1 hypothetical protein [Flavobacterium rakeshii]MUV05092.1 hypothetical protein [Flavobacterium rakeshii]